MDLLGVPSGRAIASVSVATTTATVTIGEGAGDARSDTDETRVARHEHADAGDYDRGHSRSLAAGPSSSPRSGRRSGEQFRCGRVVVR